MTAVNRPTYVKLQYGYSQESLPYVETIAPKLRKAIVKGKDNNLTMLLMPPDHYFEAKDTYNKFKQDPKLNRMLSIEEFITAFGIYTKTSCANNFHLQIRPIYMKETLKMCLQDNEEVPFMIGGTSQIQ